MGTKNSYLALILALIVVTSCSLIQERNKTLLNDSDVVYVVPGENVFHLKSCEKIKNKYTGMALTYALKKGYKPCPICIGKMDLMEANKNRRTIQVRRKKTDNLLMQEQHVPIVPTAEQVKAYRTKIYKEERDILQLDNGAILEITYGYLGFLGFRKDCVLFQSGSIWKIWIEGKKVYNCNLLKYPQYGQQIPAKLLYIHEVKVDGKILVMSDGSIYEVDDLYTIDTRLWLAMSKALLLNDFQIINLDEGNEIIDLIRIK